MVTFCQGLADPDDPAERDRALNALPAYLARMKTYSEETCQPEGSNWRHALFVVPLIWHCTVHFVSLGSLQVLTSFPPQIRPLTAPSVQNRNF